LSFFFFKCIIMKKLWEALRRRWSVAVAFSPQISYTWRPLCFLFVRQCFVVSFFSL
jgi:hypothetical protein